MKKLVKNCKKNNAAVIKLYYGEPGNGCTNMISCNGGSNCNNWLNVYHCNNFFCTSIDPFC